jgi:hypothetical protein
MPETVRDVLPVILNAANANRLLNVTINPSPDFKRDPHYLVVMKLATVDRGPKHTPNSPHFILTRILWDRSYRLTGQMDLFDSAEKWSAEAANEVVRILKQ